MCPTLPVQTPSRTYDIVCERGALRRLGPLCEDVLGPQGLFVVSQETVWGLYGETVKRSLKKKFLGQVVLLDGEAAKTLENYEKAIGTLLKTKPLPGAVLALGGGVTGDLAGFVAGTFRRGVPCVQVPTTLLSQVDSSVGGKTGIDHEGYKNYLGVFHQPHLVVIDPNVLKTLPTREMSAGLAEVVKYGLLFDRTFFEKLEDLGPRLLNPALKDYDQIILDCCAFKARVVKADERDTTGRRALLNLGHTFAHAIETTSGLGHYLHGEAVAIGLVGAARLSHRLGLTRQDLSPRITALLKKLQLPVYLPGGQLSNLLEAIKYDKKFTSGQNAFVLLKGIGRCALVKGVPAEAIRETFKSLLKEPTP